MSTGKLEIHDVVAHHVDADGRVRGLRVIGVGPRRDRRIFVTLSLEADERLRQPKLDFAIEEDARFVRPEAVGSQASLVAARSGSEVDAVGRTLHLWCAEFELASHPSFPPLWLGPLARALTVDARCTHDPDKLVARQYVVEMLQLEPAYPLGVLFVHGIGTQARSETLSHWTAPLLRWLDGWFAAAARRLGERAAPDDLDDWLAGLLVRENLDEFEPDHEIRYRLATRFADHVAAKTYGSDIEALVGSSQRTLATLDLRVLDPGERERSERFSRYLRTELGADIVGGKAELADARLIDRDAPVTLPSTVELHVASLAADGEVERSAWLMAESHWAESFLPPPFAPFSNWCLRIAPVVWVYSFAKIFERSRHSWARAAWAVVPLATVVLAMIVGLLALRVLSLIPWPRLHAALASAQRSLAGVVGDSYVFVKDVVQRHAIVERVRRDIEWLKHRCCKVVVVAHSQGAALAYQALDTRLGGKSTPQVDALVTLGAGVETLKRLADLSNVTTFLATGWTALAGAAMLWAGGLGVLSLAGPWSVATVLVGATILLAAGVSGVRAYRRLPGLTGNARAPRHDFFATHDPVPWGPIDRGVSTSSYLPQEVSNRHSFVTDHTTYWQNPEQVVGPIAAVLAEVAGMCSLDHSVPNAAATKTALVRARSSRVRWLHWARIVMLACTLALCVGEASSLLGAAHWLGDMVRSRLGLISGSAEPFPGVRSVGYGLAVVVPYALYVTLVVASWAAWGEPEMRRILRAQASVRARGWRLAFAASIAATLAITAMLLRIP